MGIVFGKKKNNVALQQNVVDTETKATAAAAAESPKRYTVLLE